MKRILVAAALAGVGCASPAMAQSAFDGFRLGLEGTASWNSLKVDASRPRDAALASGRQSLANGEASLEAGRRSLAEGEATQANAVASLAEGRSRLAEGEAAAARYRALTGSATTPFDDGIARGRAAVEAGQQAVDAGALLLEQGRARLASGEARLATGRAQLGVLEAFPARETYRDNGAGVRLSAGWGTTVWGGLHLGLEGDIGRSDGEMVVEVPTRPEYLVSFGNVASVSVRTGWVVHPRVLLYSTTGWEATQWKVDTGTKKTSAYHHGARAGVGIEVAIGDGFNFRVGYDRSIMGHATFAGAEVRPSRNTIHFGLVKVF